MMKRCIAVDLGGSAVKYGLINEEGKIINRGKTIAPRQSMEQFKEVMSGIIHQYDGQADRLGISFAGKLDPADGTIYSSGQYPFLLHLSVVKTLAEICSLHITVQNDAHAAALAEMGFGSLKDVNNAIVVVLGTGIGGAVILDRKILQGVHFCAAEFSLLRTDRHLNLERAWCNYGGGFTGLQAIVKEKLQTHENPDGFQIFKMADEGNQAVLDAIDEYCMISAEQIYNLQAIFDTEKIAIGGGISAQQRLFDGIEKYMDIIFDEEEPLHLAVHRPKIVPCMFHNDANLIGAWYDCNIR